MTDATKEPKIEDIEKLTGTIELKNASTNFDLDRNLTKSCGMAQLKQKMTRAVNFDFKNLTKNVLDQKDSNLCVPISVSILLRSAIKKDLDPSEYVLKEHFTVEKILTQLTMVIYPRSLAGMSYNPRHTDKQFQHAKIEALLKRMKYPTYLYKSGWGIISGNHQANYDVRGSFDFNDGKKNSFN